MPVSSSTEHWIKPDALTINLNHFGDPDYLQVSVLAGAVVMAFKQDVIGYNAAHNYRTWPLDAANTYLETTSAVNVYAKLTRSEVNARALIAYDTVLRDIEGREITYAEDGSEILGEPSPDLYYVFLGQISASVNSNGESVQREWSSLLKFGSLQTNQQQNDLYGGFERMFRPHYDDPLNPDKITWIEALAHLGVIGGITLYVDGGNIDLPSLYAGIPVDGTTITKREDGTLMLNPNLELGGLDEEALQKYLDDYNYAKLSDIPSLDGYAKLSDIPSLDGYAKITDVDSRINDLVNGAPAAYDTLKEIADVLQGNVNSIGDIITTLGTKADKTYVDDTFATKSSLNATNAEVAKKWTQDNDKIANWDTAYGWGNHANAGYFLASNFTKANIVAKLSINDWALAATKPSYTTKEVTEDTNLYFTNKRAIDALAGTLKAYVTLKGTQTIEGEKNFTGGLKVNGSPIIYNSEKGYWLLQGNLLITGGLTMYADDGSVDLPNLYDGLPIDNQTIYWENGVLKAVGGGGVADSVAWADITGKPSFATVATSGSYNDLLNKPTLLSSFTNDVGFITNDVDGSMRIGSTVYISDSDTVYGVELYGTDAEGVIGVHSYGAWKCGNISLYPNGNTTINGNLSISTGADTKLILNNTDSDTNYSAISFRQNGVEHGRLGIMAVGGNTLGWNTHTLLHSGNYSSYALPLTGGTLTGNVYFGTDNTGVNATGSATRLPSHIYRNVYETSGNVYDHYYNNNYTASTNTFANLRVKTSGGFKVLRFGGDGTFTWDGKTLYHSGNLTKLSQLTNDSGFITSSASISGNAASATKLATARTIWGQSFDGTGNVSGDFTSGCIHVHRNNEINSYVSALTDNIALHLQFRVPGNVSLCAGGGNVGIGTTSPSYKLDVNGSLNATTIYQNGSTLDSLLSAKLNSSSYTAADVLAKLKTVDGSGSGLDADTLDGKHLSDILNSNVASATKLQTPRTIWGQSFDGTGNVSGALSGVGNITTNNSNADIYLQQSTDSRSWWTGIGISSGDDKYVIYDATAKQHRLSIDTSGNVGIGTVTPIEKLHVKGKILSNSIRIYGEQVTDNSKGLFIQASDKTNRAWITWNGNIGNSDYLNIATQYGNIVLAPARNVGIGTTSPSYKLHVAGTAYISSNLLTGGGITMYSQRSLKNVIDEDGLSLRELSVIKPTRYTWKDKRDERLHIGGIADDIQQVLPEVVYRTPDGILTMDYGNAAFAIASSLINPMIEHESEIVSLKRRVRELEEEVKRLRA